MAEGTGKEKHIPPEVEILRQRVGDLESMLEDKERFEERLADQLEFFQILLDAIPTPLFLQDMNGNVTLCNQAFETVAQTLREEIIGKDLDEVIEDPELLRVLRCGEIDPATFYEKQHQEAQVVFADGTTRHVEVKHEVVFNLNGEPSGSVGLLIDLTDRQRAERAEIEAERLRTAQKLAISVAHEFNNPLMIISGAYQYSHTVLKETAEPRVLNLLERIPKAVERMKDLVNKMTRITHLKEAEYAAGTTFYDLHAIDEENLPEAGLEGVYDRKPGSPKSSREGE